MGILYIALAAFGGGVVAALLGWLKSGEGFVSRKFAASVLRALLAGGATAIASPIIGEVSVFVLIVAFLAGAGVDVIGHRIAGNVK